MEIPVNDEENIMELNQLFEEIERSENDFCSFVEEYRGSDKKVFLFGAGLSGRKYKEMLEKEHFPIAGVIDNYGGELQGTPALPLKTVLRRYPVEDCVFLVSAPRSQAEICKQLLEVADSRQIYQFAASRILVPGCSPAETKDYYLSHREDLTDLYRVLGDDWSRKVLENMLLGQVKGSFDCFDKVRTGDFYYPPDIVEFRKNEIMVELGSNDGETLLDFINRCPEFQKAYCFEPDECSIEKLEKVARPYKDRITIIPKIAWKEAGELGFSSDGGDGASMVQMDADKPHILVAAAAVDDEVKERITYMKLDVEGAERMALQGAGNQIVQNKPKLAVSMYHKKEDIVELPRYIHSLRPDYCFYLRHHGWDESDTVLYAV